ncbi:hypothetical protein ACFLVN_02810 [Chloroflexota bacterium]
MRSLSILFALMLVLLSPAPAVASNLVVASPNTTIVTLEAYESQEEEASCPWVFTWNGSEYVRDNDVYSTARGAAKEFTDYYTLNEPLLPKDGNYSLELREVTAETSYTDLVQLMAVDHPSNVKIASDENGVVWTYSNPSPPVSAIDNEGSDVLSQVTTEDNSGFKGYNDDYLTLDFGDLIVGESAILMLRVNGFEDDGEAGDPTGVRPYVFIQTQNVDGEWVTRRSFYPRDDWAISAYNLAEYLTSNNMVRLYMTSCHTGKYQIIDYVGLDTSAQSPVTVHTLSPTSAMHSISGDVLDRVSNSDDEYANMSPSEKMTFTFPMLDMAGEARDFVLVSEGYYIPDGTYYIYTWDGIDWVERDSWEVGAEGDQVHDFDLSQFLPDADGQYRVRIFQDYWWDEAGIDYVGITHNGIPGIMTRAWDFQKDEPVIAELLASDNHRDDFLQEEEGDRWVEVAWSFALQPPITEDFEDGNMLTGWGMVDGCLAHVEVLPFTDFNPDFPAQPANGDYAVLLSTGGASEPEGPGFEVMVQSFRESAASLFVEGMQQDSACDDDLDGNGIPDYDTSTLIFTFELLPEQAPTMLSFQWSFLTSEFADPYDDFFMVTLNGANILSGSVPELSVSPFPDTPPLDGFDHDVISPGLTNGSKFSEGACPLQTFSHEITSPGTYTLEFLVADQQDSDVDSGLLIDQVTISSANAMRDLPGDSVDPSGTFEVRITADDFGAFGQVIETLPEGFAYIPGSATPVSGMEGIIGEVDGQSVSFSWLNTGQTAIEFTYHATVPDTPGGSFVFAGILQDQNRNVYTIEGDIAISIGLTPWTPGVYDSNPPDGTIDILEVLTAISDYFGRQITIAQALQVIGLYFSGSV